MTKLHQIAIISTSAMLKKRPNTKVPAIPETALNSLGSKSDLRRTPRQFGPLGLHSDRIEEACPSNRVLHFDLFSGVKTEPPPGHRTIKRALPFGINGSTGRYPFEPVYVSR